jgi:hypothetical protein
MLITVMNNHFRFILASSVADTVLPTLLFLLVLTTQEGGDV